MPEHRRVKASSDSVVMCGCQAGDGAQRLLRQSASLARVYVLEADPLYAKLVPLVKVLEAVGNVSVDGGFLNSPAGWYCRMRDPIDFDLLRDRDVLLPTFDVSEARDTVLDRATWSAVLGPGSPTYGALST